MNIAKFIVLLTLLPSLSFANIMDSDLLTKLSNLEKTTDGHLGIAALDTANMTNIQYHANEIFPSGCTSKLIGVAAILKKSMQDKSFLQQRIYFTENDLVTWSPDTKNHLNDGMTIAELSAAALTKSDNTAMNLLLAKLGGINSMNQFARSIGDMSFRQDNNWPSEAMSGGRNNVKDSTTPNAMLNSLRKIAFGNVLAPSQRELLLQWMKANTTGDKRIRAGVPKDWIVGDKTGTGSYYGTTNDIGIIWPANCAPLLVTIYYTSNNKHAIKRDNILAKATRIIVSEFSHNNPCLQNEIQV